MKEVKNFIKSSHTQVALATAICIVVIAYFSKKVFIKPVGNLINAIPGLLMLLWELLYSKNKRSKLLKAKYWVIGIFIITGIIIILNYIYN